MPRPRNPSPTTPTTDGTISFAAPVWDIGIFFFGIRFEFRDEDLVLRTQCLQILVLNFFGLLFAELLELLPQLRPRICQDRNGEQRRVGRAGFSDRQRADGN